MTGMVDKSVNETPPEAMYMVVRLSQITKKQYDEMLARSQEWTRRQLGFVVESQGVRTMYINEDGKYYEGKMDPDHTIQMFLKRQTKGVEVITRIVFTEVTR